MLKIEPIKLLRGCHEHTGRTGQGCFLNVCSYLEGESPISDTPDSVHYALRRSLMAINDNTPDGLRQGLLPFVHRAMLTGGDDKPFDSADRYNDAMVALAEKLYEQAKRIARGNTAIDLDEGIHDVRSDCSEPVCSRAGRSIHLSLFILFAAGQGRKQVLVYSPDGLSATVMCPDQFAFETVVKALDDVLPHDVAPSRSLATAAQHLVEARAAWGDKPVPAAPIGAASIVAALAKLNQFNKLQDVKPWKALLVDFADAAFIPFDAYALSKPVAVGYAPSKPKNLPKGPVLHKHYWLPGC